MEQLDPVERLRRRERQQSLVAELGRTALTETTLPELLDHTLAAAAEGLDVERVVLFEPEDDMLRVRSSRGWMSDKLTPVPLHATTVVATTFRTTEPHVVDELAEDSRFPDSQAFLGLEMASAIAAPIRDESGALGVLAAHSPEPRAFASDDLLFLRALANIVAVSMARRRADEARRRSDEGLQLLAEAGDVLQRTLDYEETLSALAHLIVPQLADWLIVDVADDDGMMRRVAVVAAVPEKQALLEELRRSYPPGPGSRQPAARALTSHSAVHYPAFTPEMLRETTRDDRHYELIEKLDPRSAIAVPLIAHERLLGALTFAWSESAREYDAADIALAEEIARRAALAIDNARIYRREEDARRRVEFLAESSTLLSGSLDYEETLSSVARLAVPRIADWCLFYMLEEDGSISRTAVEHGGGRQEAVRAVLAGHAIQPDAPTGVPMVIREGRSELIADATPVSLASDVAEPEQLASALAEVEVRSTMCVPLTARGRTFGALLFVSAESNRRFAEDDLRLAEELAGRAAVAVDNSRLYRAAEERAEAAQALATVADGVVFVDRHTTIRVWNPAAEAITGIAAGTVRGRRATELWPDYERYADAVPIAPAPAQTIPFSVRGAEQWLSIVGVESSEGTVYTFRDVTEERKLDRLKSDFVATVSHELRTPLAAVYGAAVTLSDRDLTGRPEVHKALIDQIVEQTERLTTIVSDILLASELEAGRFQLTRGEIDPVEVARGSVEAARPRLPQNIDLELVVPGRVSQLESDPGRLRQVLDNLVENAVKYSPDGGRVELRVEQTKASIVFSVSDTGVGIPAGELERIFEKFYRLDPEQTRGVSGTGLGLYVCRELVERMDGRISVSSRVGRGSTFTVELPRH